MKKRKFKIGDIVIIKVLINIPWYRIGKIVYIHKKNRFTYDVETGDGVYPSLEKELILLRKEDIDYINKCIIKYRKRIEKFEIKLKE